MTAKLPVEVRGATEEELRAHPFWPVVQHIFNGVVAARLDRADDLAVALEGSLIVLAVSNSWECSYDPKTGEIIVSTAVVESLWSAAHAYHLLYKGVESTHGGQQGNVEAGTERHKALEDLRWALGRHFKPMKEPWPPNAPRPPDPALGQTTSRSVASEIALVALAFVILHEIAHHSLSHEPTGDYARRIQMERDADNSAADWILGGKGDNEAAREKMRLGIIVACGWMLAVESIRWKRGQLGAPSHRTHPPAYSRLFALTERWSTDPNATTWCFTVAIVQLHMQHIGLEVPRGPFTNCREAADALVDVLAEQLS